MKITINQDHVESIKQKLIDDVIVQAKRSAEKGLEYFTFYPGFNLLHMKDYSSYHLINDVKEATEGTVDCVAKGNKHTSIEFQIKQV